MRTYVLLGLVLEDVEYVEAVVLVHVEGLVRAVLVVEGVIRKGDIRRIAVLEEGRRQ